MKQMRKEINPFTVAIKSAFTKRDLPHSLLYAPESNSHAGPGAYTRFRDQVHAEYHDMYTTCSDNGMGNGFGI